MVRNNGKGGKNFRKSKNVSFNNRRTLEYKTEGQEYAIITAMLGNSRCECKCNDGLTRLGHIRGSMNKRVWISKGDTVLVALRDFQDDKVDIIHKYTLDETKTLRSYNELNIVIDESIHDVEESGIEFSNESNTNDIDFDDI